jgi:replication factor C subunit 2/4
MNTPFLKKYQPQFYKDFTIDDEYIELLTTLINMNNLNILLVGNSGCGKTSLLYATIREYYQQDNIPKNNVLYINNLKEQGIQYYRTEVKTFCQTPSMIFGKKKFIILDDIDLINDQSQQVFRNCIDKYSHNVHFLASCSNTQRVIDSIQSRCTIIKIKPVAKPFLKKIYNKIKKSENIDIDNKAEEFILNICNNSVRLLINYMEKFKLLNMSINERKVKEICTNISFYEFEKYTEEWYKKKDLKFAIQIIQSIYKKGYSVMDILDSYFTFIKVTNLLDETIKYKVIKLILKYIALFHTLHENDIELAFFTNELIKLL